MDGATDRPGKPPLLLPAQQALLDRLIDGVAHDRIEMVEREALIPVDEYLSPERFERELALIRRSPVAAVSASMLPKAGHCMTHDWLGVPMILARAKDGQLRAFLNVCRHRSTRVLTTEGVGRTSALVCPYHNWTYGLDGALVDVPMPEAFPNVDRACHGLVELPSAERYGQLWVAANADATFDSDGYFGASGDELDVFGLDAMVTYDRHVSHVDANWKLVYDAFFEAYHVHRLHKKSLAGFFTDSHVVIERDGRHIRSLVGRADIDASTAALDDLARLREQVTFVYYVFPTTLVVVSPDYVNVVSIYPQATDRTVVVNSLLIDEMPQTDDDKEHWARSFELICKTVFEGEDYRMAELGQPGLASGANDHLTLGRFEHGVAMFHAVINDALGEM